MEEMGADGGAGGTVKERAVTVALKRVGVRLVGWSGVSGTERVRSE